MTKKIIILSAIIALCVIYYNSIKKTSDKSISLSSNTLVVGISPDYPPYAQIDLKTGEIVGLEVDVIHEIGRRLDKKIEIKDMPFNSLILELMPGHIDMIAAGLSPNEERKKTVLFSLPYIDNDEIIVVSKKSKPAISKVEDLYGQSVAVNLGYTSDSFLSKYPEIQLIRLKTPTDGVVALNSNSVDAFATSKSSFDIFLEKQSENHIYQFFTLPASADACALVYKKNNTKLQAEIDPVIQDMIEDGTMHIIKKKWGFE